MISALIPFGAIFGAPIGGVIASLGRRPAMIMISTVFAVACLMTSFMNFFSLLLGRLIMGVCIGAYISVTPLIVIEISPKSIAGQLGVIGQFMCVIGILLAVSLGFLVPYADDDDALTTNIWRQLFRVPIISSSFQIFMLLFVFTIDTPTFYEQRNDSVNYEKSMKKIYDNPKYIYAISSLLDEPTVAVPNQSGDISWSQLLSFPNRRHLIVGLLFGFFQQATGISMVTFFSNEIFSKGKTGASAEFAARIGTFGTGVAGVLAAIAAIVMARHYGRRTLLIAGEVLMAFLLAFLSNCAFSGYQTPTIVATVMFVFVFNTSFGPLLWLYVSEILGAKGISLVAFVNLLFTVVFGCLGNIFIELLTPAGMYITLFFIQIVCIVFLQQYVIETKGKTREECMTLYFPKVDSKQLLKVEMEEI